jgi:O-antigen ligase
VIANLLFLFLVINLISSRKLLVQALIVWLCVSAVIGIYSIYDWHLGSGLKSALVLNESDPGKGVQSTSNRWTTIWHDAAELETLSGKSLKRTMGSTSHSAVYGINLVLTVPFLLFFLKFAPRPWQKILILGVSAVIAYNILLTNTRSTILLTGVVGLMCWHKGLVKLTPSVLIIGGLTVILAGIFIIPEDIYNRVLDISNYSRDHSASLRIREEYIRAGLKAFGDSWLIGHGAANETLIPSYLPRWISAPSRTMTHNIYLQTLAELGVIGGLLLFSFVGILLKYCYQTIARLERIPDMKQEIMLVNAIKISMIATLIYGLQVDVFHFPLKGWWMLAGMTVFLHRFSLSHSTNNTANKS